MPLRYTYYINQEPHVHCLQQQRIHEEMAISKIGKDALKNVNNQ